MTRTLLGTIAVAAALALSAGALGQERAPSPTDAIAALEKAVVATIEKTNDSLVAIARVRKDGRNRGMEEFDLLPGPFPGVKSVPSPENPEFIPQEYGTGVIVDRAGLVVTAYHVLGDIPKNEYYIWSNRTCYKATVLAADGWMDIAVLKIEDADHKDFQPIAFGDAKLLKKGQFVIALGNPHGIAKDGRASAQWGLVANLERAPAPMRPRSVSAGALAKESLHHYGTLIETDARLEHGASGGALVNLDGQMIGLTTTYAARDDVEAVAGLAIPVDQPFKDALEKLKAGKKAEYGFLGVKPEDDLGGSPRKRGAVIQEAVLGTPAAEAGLHGRGDVDRRRDPRWQDYDTITHVEGQEVANSSHLMLLLGRMPVEKKVTLSIRRTSLSDASNAVFQKQVVLSKKSLGEPLRPEYATVGEKPWRGLTVDYATAKQGFSDDPRYDPAGCIAVMDVELDSPARKAGIRSIYYIARVGDQVVKKPADFYRAVEKQTGPVVLRMTATIEGTNSKIATVAVP